MSLCGLSKVINLSRHYTSWLYYLEKICKDNVCIKKIKQFYSWRTLWNIKERRVLSTSMWKRTWVAPYNIGELSSVHFSHSVVSNSLWPHESQHARPPCPSPTPGVYPNSYPLSWWYHPTISSSVVPFSSCLQSFPASGSFQMSQFFASDG